MKGIVQFLLEATSDVNKVYKVKVIYKVSPDKFTVVVPKNYSESDMQVYLDDVCLNELPGSNDESKKVLGNNIDEIQDAYFEYSKYTASDKPTDNITLAWDPKYDANNSEEIFTYFTLEELKYIIEFGEFKLKNTDNIEKDLKEIFEAFNSVDEDRYPIQIELETIDYHE